LPRKLTVEGPLTQQVQQDAAGVWGVPHSLISMHHGQASLRPCHPPGRAEGRSPSAFLLSPKTGGQGVEISTVDWMMEIVVDPTG